VRGGDAATWLLLLAGVIVFLSYSELADEVIDRGDSLFVKRGRHRMQVPLDQVAAVVQSKFAYPAVITLRLAQPIEGVEKVEFLPRTSGWSQSTKRGNAEDLMMRVRTARARAGF
jgi:hypothetical protein